METLTKAPTRKFPVVPDPVLAETASLLREGWGQGSLEKEPPFWLRLFGAKPRYCLSGALGKVVAAHEDETLAGFYRHRFYVGLLGFRSEDELIDWNDEYGRTQEEVVERVERTAYGL
jgi:hypothetical protein